MGRRKIEIQPLTDDRNRTVTFVKRKAGLFKKAHELAVLCQVDLAVIIVGNNNKIYEFSSVDTGELIKHYKGVKSPHESKSPENYGNYKKKKHLADQNGYPTMYESMPIGDDQIDSDYDSETPEPKRRKRSYQEANNQVIYQKNQKARPNPPSHISLSQVPPFNAQYKKQEKKDSYENLKSQSEESSSGRPVLRVQIPTDAKANHEDSAKTITAMESNAQVGRQRTPDSSSSNIGSSSHNDGTSIPNVNSVKYSNFSTFKSSDTKKPITTLPLPIHSKSQTSSPSSATAPGLPMSGLSFFNSMPQSSPNSQYPNTSILPTPILNQVFGHQHPNQSQHQQQNMQGSNNQNRRQGAPQNSKSQPIQQRSNRVSGQSVQSAAHTSQQPTHEESSIDGRSSMNSSANEVSMPGSSNPTTANYQGKYRPPMFIHNQYINGEQTPSSLLPSRYIGDMFPSPSNFYASQDWPNAGSTGMTPIHSIPPQYFTGLGVNLGQSHLSKQNPQTNPQAPPNSQNPGDQSHNQHHPNTSKPDALPSPFQFMGSFNTPLSHTPTNSNGLSGTKSQGK